QVAPDAQVTFSEDASAPTAGNDVGIVVVGETPYAEGFGDVGGPLWQDNGVPREPKTMRLNAADRAAVDRVLRLNRRLRGRGRLRPADDRNRPARRDGRAGGGLAARQPGRGRGRRPVRTPAVHRPAVDDLAAHARAGAHQHRRPRLPPAVPLRVRAAYRTQLSAGQRRAPGPTGWAGGRSPTGRS